MLEQMKKKTQAFGIEDWVKGVSVHGLSPREMEEATGLKAPKDLYFQISEVQERENSINESNSKSSSSRDYDRFKSQVQNP